MGCWGEVFSSIGEIDWFCIVSSKYVALRQSIPPGLDFSNGRLIREKILWD